MKPLHPLLEFKTMNVSQRGCIGFKIELPNGAINLEVTLPLEKTFLNLPQGVYGFQVEQHSLGSFDHL